MYGEQYSSRIEYIFLLSEKALHQLNSIRFSKYHKTFRHYFIKLKWEIFFKSRFFRQFYRQTNKI